MAETAGLNVLRVMARLNTGGPSRHVVLLDAGLRARGHRTLLVHGAVSATEASMEPLADAHGIPRVRLPYLGRSLRLFDDLRAVIHVTRLLFRERPDIVHTHTSKAGMVGRSAAWAYNLFAFTRRGRGRRCVVIHTFHGHVFDGYFSPLVTRGVLTIERALARVSDRIVTISPRQRADIVSRYRIAPDARVATIPLGLDLKTLLALTAAGSGLRDELQIPRDAVVVGFVGRLVPIKDPHTLVRAFARARERCPNLYLLLAGDGQLRASTLVVADTCGVRDHVRSIGWWNGPLERLYETIDVCALSSINEGTPVALIEAMAAGRPVVATMVGGVPDVVTDGVDGLLVPPRDLERLAGALVALCADASRRGVLGQAGRAKVATRYAAPRLVDDVERLYQELTRTRP